MEPIETLEHTGFTIEIYQNEDPESPREWDNLGKMVCFHRRYNLGDKHDWPLNREGANTFREFLEENEENLIALPLYLYDHSGLRMKIGSFQGLLPQGHAEFDSGLVGWIYVDKEKVIKEYGKWNKETVEKATKILEGEVDTYDDYLSGNVFGYMIKDKDDEVLDSCWGFYPDHGEPGGLTTYVEKEARSAVDHIYRLSMIQFNLFDAPTLSAAAA